MTVADREIFLAAELEARRAWDAAVAAVAPSAVAERSLPGDRSVKDTVAHIAAWERWGTERLAARRDGAALAPIAEWELFEHAFNERTTARWRDEAWENVIAEAAVAYGSFRETVESLDDEQLAASRQLIESCGSLHYAEYIEQVRSFVDSLPPLASFKTSRLRLRSLRPSDAAVLLGLFTDPEVMRYIPPGPPFTFERVRRAMDRRIAMERETGLTLWAVERRDTQELIGQCGFSLVEGTGPEVEIAYHYARAAWGQGFGTEAAVAALARGFSQLGLERVIAICYPENTASWRVMEKAGMRSDGEGEYYGIRMKRYVAEAASWHPPHERGASS